MPQLIFSVNSLNVGLTREDNIKVHVQEAEYEDMD
jgi:hypothetical protein